MRTQLVSTSKQGQWTTVASLSVFGSIFAILFGAVKRVLQYFVLQADEHHAAAAAASSVQLQTVSQQAPKPAAPQHQSQSQPSASQDAQPVASDDGMRAQLALALLS